MSTNPVDEIWYEVFGKRDLDITAVAVERVSEKCLWLKGTTSQRARRVNRGGEWANYFATKEAALTHIRHRLEDNAAKAKEYYLACQDRLDAFDCAQARNKRGA